MRVTDARATRARQGQDVPASELFRRYVALTELTHGAVIVSDLDGVILTWDGEAERMFGFSRAEALGQSLSLIVPADRAGEAMRSLRSVASGESAQPLRTIRVRRDKTLIDVSLTVTTIRDSENRVVGAMSVARDLSTSQDGEGLLGATQAALSDANVFLDKAERLSRTGTWILRFGAELSMTWSPECYRVLGLDDAEPVTVDLFLSMVHPDDLDRVQGAMTRALGDRSSYEVEYRMVCTDGSIRWIHAWAEPEFDDAGEPVRLLGVVQDVTERHAANEALRASESRFRLLAENARDLIFRLVLLPEPRFEYVSPAVFDITGYTPEEIYDEPALANVLMGGEHVPRVEDLLEWSRLPDPIDVEIRRKNGTVVWVSRQLTLVRDETDTVIAVEGIDRDITERKRAEDERAHANLHDALTELPSRQLLSQRLELDRGRARDEGCAAFVVALDLDDFALINDSHGYETGDAVLVAVGGLLTAISTEGMSVGRTGSDEFMIVGCDTAGVKVSGLVERIRGELGRPIRCNGTEFVLHARMGVAVDDLISSSDDLLRSAEIALALAKHRRTDTGVEFFDVSMRASADERLALVNDLYVALERGEFELRYQPIVQLADDRIIGVETLIRWRHPQRGLVDPSVFIPLAEDTGLIVNIGAWVLNEACAQLRSWSDATPSFGQLGMAVNLSVKQLRSPGIVMTVAEALRRSGIEAGRLTVEMTESVFASDLEAIRVVLDELRALGVRTAIDDFGTGYSSLAYLKHLPIDTIKIDKTFIDGLGADPRDDAIIESTLTVAKALRLFTVAEGVETAEQLAAIRAMDCRAAQGFYFSEPVTGAAFASIVIPPSAVSADPDAGDAPFPLESIGSEAACVDGAIVAPSASSVKKGVSFDPGPSVAPKAVLEATRALLWLDTAGDVRRIAEWLVRELGGSVVAATADDGDAIPADLSFGDGAPALATAVRNSSARALIDEHLPAFLSDARQVLELSGRTQRLAESASTDALTSLPNRRMIERALGRLDDDDTVIMIDLDHFKRVNDEFGHAAGDDVLRAFGHVLREVIRGRDLVGRYGGEEFLAILKGPGGADAFLERLRLDWGRARTWPVSFSAGIAAFVGDADQTVEMADEALYRAKAAGRDQWQWATPEPARQHQHPHDYVDTYLDDALIGQRQAAIRLTLDLLDTRVPKAAIVDDLLGAAQKEVGERWYRNELTAADEHIATGVTTAALDALSSETKPASADDLVVVACAEGDWHALAAQMFGESLRAHGTNVTVLGASTPAEVVGEFLARSGCQALAISCSVPTFLAGAVNLIDAAHRQGIPAIVGGRAFGCDARRAEHLGADAWASSADGASVILTEWRSRPPSITRDPIPLDPVAVRLIAQADRLGANALQRLIADFPPVADFDDRQLARTREDLVFIVEFLAAATLADAPEIFAEFLDWLEALLVNRGVPPRSLVSGLDALEPSIAAIDPAAAQLIASGREQLISGTGQRSVTRTT